MPPAPALMALMPFVGVAEAVWPMTAIVLSVPDSGRMSPWFFSSTLPSSDIVKAVATWAGVVTWAAGVAGSGVSKTPILNMVLR